MHSGVDEVLEEMAEVGRATDGGHEADGLEGVFDDHGLYYPFRLRLCTVSEGISADELFCSSGTAVDSDEPFLAAGRDDRAYVPERCFVLVQELTHRAVGTLGTAANLD